MVMRKRREKKELGVPSDSGGEGAVRHLGADERTVLICSSWNGRSESICLPRMHKTTQGRSLGVRFPFPFKLIKNQTKLIIFLLRIDLF